MSAVATRERGRPGLERGSAEPPAQRLFEPKGPTLEAAILATWRDLLQTLYGPPTFRPFPMPPSASP